MVVKTQTLVPREIHAILCLNQDIRGYFLRACKATQSGIRSTRSVLNDQWRAEHLNLLFTALRSNARTEVYSYQPQNKQINCTWWALKAKPHINYRYREFNQYLSQKWPCFDLFHSEITLTGSGLDLHRDGLLLADPVIGNQWITIKDSCDLEVKGSCHPCRPRYMCL